MLGLEPGGENDPVPGTAAQLDTRGATWKSSDSSSEDAGARCAVRDIIDLPDPASK